MITLYQMLPVNNLPNPSPPCMKLETWLRMTKIPYQKGGLDVSRAPKGKLPYIDEDGVVLGDSTFIIDYLEKKHDVHPDAHLSASERAVAMAFRRMLKENFYWVIVYIRWIDEANWTRWRLVIADQFPAAIPLEQRLGIVDGIQPGMVASIKGQGMGRHTFDEVCRIGRDDLTAIRDYLGDKPYLMGDRISTVDATAYANIANILLADVDSPLRDWARDQKTLVDYHDRMAAEYFPEFVSKAAT